MKKNASFGGKFFFLVVMASVFLLEPGLAASKKKKNAQEEKNTVETTVQKDGSVKLAASAKKRTYLYKINESIVAGVEKGSPDSIKIAMEALRKNESEYTEPEKTLIYSAATIMQIVWPSEKITWGVFDVIEANPYIGAINSVHNGVYDSSTGNVDFLTSLLPTLVMFTTTLDQNILPLCYEGLMTAQGYNADSVLLNYLLGAYSVKVNDYTAAEEYFKKAYMDSPMALELCLEYSKVLIKNGKAQVAAEVMAGVNQGNANSLQVLKQNAYIAFDCGDFSLAEDYVARVLQQTPNDLEFVLFRARIFIEKKDFIHAVSLLDMYSRQNDTNIDYLILRSRVQLDWSKNIIAATETIEKALQLYPENQDALMIAAKISAATDAPVTGKYADELAELVLQKNPDNFEASIYALNGLVQRENWEPAYEISSRLIKVQPDNGEVVLNHVTVCVKTSRKSEALETATAAYNKNPSNETIAQAYIYAYTELKPREEALALVNSILNSAAPKLKSYLYFRRSYLQRTEENSLADLRSSLIANPRNSEALFRLYEIYFTKEDYRKAQYYLRQVVAINPNDSSYRKLNEALTQLIK